MLAAFPGVAFSMSPGLAERRHMRNIMAGTEDERRLHQYMTAYIHGKDVEDAARLPIVPGDASYAQSQTATFDQNAPPFAFVAPNDTMINASAQPGPIATTTQQVQDPQSAQIPSATNTEVQNGPDASTNGHFAQNTSRSWAYPWSAFTNLLVPSRTHSAASVASSIASSSPRLPFQRISATQTAPTAVSTQAQTSNEKSIKPIQEQHGTVATGSRRGSPAMQEWNVLLGEINGLLDDAGSAIEGAQWGSQKENVPVGQDGGAMTNNGLSEKAQGKQKAASPQSAHDVQMAEQQASTANESAEPKSVGVSYDSVENANLRVEEVPVSAGLVLPGGSATNTSHPTDTTHRQDTNNTDVQNAVHNPQAASADEAPMDVQMEDGTNANSEQATDATASNSDVIMDQAEETSNPTSAAQDNGPANMTSPQATSAEGAVNPPAPTRDTDNVVPLHRHLMFLWLK